MDTRTLFKLALIAATFGTSSAAFAADSTKMANGKSIFGEPAERSPYALIVDTKTAKYANIKCGEIITFVNGGKSFSWKFDVVNHSAVDIRKIAPADFTDKALIVYVERNEFERN
ncbi:MAG: CzcE family metal-binding protein [Burkholderiaceae bacterium]|nr:CzcE family metal-binding protein [Burkholderiaceae bacterium]